MNNTFKTTLLVILGIIGGYATIIILSPLTTTAIQSFWAEAARENPPTLYVFIDLLYSAVYLVVGGYVAAWIAKKMTSPFILGTILCILGIVSLATGLDKVHPVWYQWIFIIIPIPAAWLGGWLRISKKLFVGSAIKPLTNPDRV